MGIYRKKKHHGERSKGDPSNDSSSNGYSQKKLTPYTGVRISKSDANDFLLPVLKEVGKCIYPPAAIPIEVLYQIYKHVGTIKEVGSAIIEGDYEQAAKVIVKEGMKEVAGAALKSAVGPGVSKTSEVLKEGVKSHLPTNEQTKEVAGNMVKGATKGFAEAVCGKIVKKVVDEVLEDEK